MSVRRQCDACGYTIPAAAGWLSVSLAIVYQGTRVQPRQHTQWDYCDEPCLKAALAVQAIATLEQLEDG